MKNVFILLGVILCCSGLLWAETSIGISPPSVTLSNVLKGGYAEGVFSVSGGAAEQDSTLLVTVDVEGPIKDWVTLDKEQFTLVSGTAQQVKFTVSPPNSTANGVYNGTISVKAVPSSKALSGDSSEMGIVSGVSGVLSIQVTGEQSLALKVDNVALSDIEEGQALEVTVTGRNTGNVNVKPSVKVEVLQDGVEALSERKDGSVEIMPTTAKSFAVSFATEELEAGDYTAKVSVYLTADNNTPVYQTNVPFKVFPAGTLGLSGELQSLVASGGYVNEPVRVQAVFENTGNGGVAAKLKGDVEMNGAFVGNFEGDDVYVAANDTVTLVAYYTPTKKGTYDVSAYVRYSKLQTKEMNTTFSVSDKPAATAQPPANQTGPQVTTSPSQPPDYTLFLIVALVIIGLIVFWKFSGEAEQPEQKPRKRK